MVDAKRTSLLTKADCDGSLSVNPLRDHGHVEKLLLGQDAMSPGE